MSKDIENLVDAIDSTAEVGVLTYLWEITKDRLEEEKSRHGSVTDRAAKLITYSLSVLAATGVSLVALKDIFLKVPHMWSSNVGYLFFIPLLFLVYLFWQTFQTWKNASKVIDAYDYMTWNEVDLARVDLGDNDFAYHRYLIKAAWSLIKHNGDINDEKMKLYSKALKSVEKAILALIVVVISSIAMYGSSGYNSNEKLNQEKNESIMSDSKKEPAKTPNPTEGKPLKREGVIPTPQPTPGKRLKNNNGNKEKK